MPLVYWGEIDAASDATMAAVTNRPGSQFRSALADLLEILIAQNETVANAAAAAAVAAVSGEIATRRLAEGAVIGAGSGTRWTDLNAVNATNAVWLQVQNTALNRPPGENVRLTGWHIPSGDGASQTLVSATSPARTWTRTKIGSTWSTWVRTVDHDALLAQVGAQRCVHLEAGVWVWDGPGAASATHYLVPDENGALVARSTLFPRPSATVPELDW